MGKIRILPDVVCHHIAAGEVVERPSAVVKELIENSLDAGSSQVTVIIERGGRGRIEVLDDGEGMDKDDALLALERHATSKVRTVEDLHSVISFGFRGEALASIAAVSRLTLVTKTARDEVGTMVRVEGGVIQEVKPVGCPIGCRVVVRDLFFNVPVRRRFLKSEQTERQHILDQCRRLALSQPSVHFKCFDGSKSLWSYSMCRDLGERIVQVFGRHLTGELVPFDATTEHLRVRGYLGSPSLQRPQSSGLFLFINGRPFRDAFLHRVVRESCRSFIPEGMFPFAVIFFEMAPEEVDVNVHPTKQEVRFRDLRAVVTALKAAVLNGVRRQEQRSPFSGDGGESVHSLPLSPSRERAYRGGVSMSPYLAPPVERCAPPYPRGDDLSWRQVLALREDTHEEYTSSSSIAILGTFADTYIVCVRDRELVLVDVHAAHESLLFEQLTAQPLPLPSQRLAVTRSLALMPDEGKLVEEKRAALLLLGYEVELFAHDMLVVRAVPSLFSDLPHEEVVRELMRYALNDRETERLVEAFASVAACHRALRAGSRLSDETIAWLVGEIRQHAHLLTCPHGRPIWITIGEREVARRFGRLP